MNGEIPNGPITNGDLEHEEEILPADSTVPDFGIESQKSDTPAEPEPMLDFVRLWFSEG